MYSFAEKTLKNRANPLNQICSAFHYKPDLKSLSSDKKRLEETATLTRNFNWKIRETRSICLSKSSAFNQERDRKSLAIQLKL
jgi:hypothetical protein